MHQNSASVFRVVMGIDPGSRVTGYGVVKYDIAKRRAFYVDSGVIRPQADEFLHRLHEIHEALRQLVARHQPDEAALEEVFVCHNVRSALKLGQARGAAAVALMGQVDTVHAYTPRAVKQAVVGYGNADKHQVQSMVKSLLALNALPPADAADALAIALCCVHQNSIASALERAGSPVATKKG